MLAQGRKSEAGSVARVSASEIEALVVDALRAAYPDDADLDERALIDAGSSASSCGPAASTSIRPRTQQARSCLPGHATARGARDPGRQGSDADRGIKAEARTVLLRSIALGRRWLDEVLGGSTLDQIADREGCTKRHVAKTIPLAFLAPISFGR